MRPETGTKGGEGPHRYASGGFRSNDRPTAERQARTHKSAGPYWSVESLARGKESRQLRRRLRFCESAHVCDRVAKAPQSPREYWRLRPNGGAGSCGGRFAASTQHRRGARSDSFPNAWLDSSSHCRGLVPTEQTPRAIVQDGPSLLTFAREALQE